jgi:ferric-dicitrate binding protein FerR (iron transport regulator)
LLKRNLKRIISISAVVILLIAVAVTFMVKDKVIFNSKDQSLQVIVPSGEKSQLILPDGTQVWLNSESKLIYPVNFSFKERWVNLEGEAYFDVTKADNSKFVVHTQNFKVKVLGTKFNVKSYPADMTIETTVVEGMVKVESEKPRLNFSPIILKSTERLVYKKDISSASKDITEPAAVKLEKPQTISRQEILISHVNTSYITSWKDHLLVFDNETFDEITLKLSRWYKVQINLVDEELKTQRYTGKFVHNESLTQVLEAIKLTTPIKYNLHQNEVEISLRNK